MTNMESNENTKSILPGGNQRYFKMHQSCYTLFLVFLLSPLRTFNDRYYMSSMITFLEQNCDSSLSTDTILQYLDLYIRLILGPINQFHKSQNATAPHPTFLF